MSLKVGILGAGSMGLRHGKILKSDRRVRLSAVFDLDERRCREASHELGCPAASSEEELLDKVDAVYITVPNTLHAGVACKALAQGKHVFCEKPMATSMEDARKVRDAWRNAGTVFQVGHNRRFAPVYRAVKRFLEDGDRRATMAQFKMNRGELESPAWVSNTSLTGGYLYETPVHLLDLACWLFGPVTDIQAGGGTHVYSEIDNFSFLMRFSEGLSMTFASCAHATWAFPFERAEIYGPHFTVETSEMEKVSITTGAREPTLTEDFHALPVEKKWGYADIDENFVSAALGELQAAVTPEDGFRVVELVDRCYRLVREQQTKQKRK